LSVGNQQLTAQENRYKDRLIPYTRREELANRVTHAAAVIASVVGLVLLVMVSSGSGDPWRVVSCSVFGASLLFFYTASTLYHSVRGDRVRYVFRILDHAGIYLLIAGTYTPITLVVLQGPTGWWLFGIVWGLAVVGIVFKAFLTHRLKFLAPVLYIALGWLIVIDFEPLLEAMPLHGIDLLIAGGVVYTVGILFYAIERIPFNHAIWHLFVMGGSLLHYLAIFYYIAPA
jgi:hemolysin III